MILQKNIREFVKRSEKLESFTLRLLRQSQFFVEIGDELKFPATLRKIDFDYFVAPFLGSNLSATFLLNMLENCKKKLEKLRIQSNQSHPNLMYFCTAAIFPNLKELIVNQTFSFVFDAAEFWYIL